MLFIAYPLSTFYELFRTTELPGYAVPCRRCLSEGVDIFLKSAERQGESGHDVRVSRSVTSRRDVPFAVGVRGVYGNPTLRDMHQFINVSQKALHIYFIDGCRVCPLDARYKNRTK